MASIFRKITSEIARPFTRDLRALLEKNQTDEIKALLIDHSRYMAENLELLCSLQTALCEKLDVLTKTLNERVGALAQEQESLLSRMNDIARIRSVFSLDSERALIRTAVGYMVCDRRDALLIAMLIESGDLEPGLRHFIQRFLGDGMTFVDVGAHIGMHAIAAGRRVGATGKVYAFEPTPKTAEYLKHNAIQNWLESVITVHAECVGAGPGRTSFHLCSINGHNSKYPIANPSETIEVPVVSLDDALMDVSAVHLIKVDVEGAELEVFAGMSRLLEKNPEVCVIAEFSPSHLKRSGTSARGWEDFIQHHGFELFIVEEPMGTLRSASIPNLMSMEIANVLMARGEAFKKVI